MNKLMVSVALVAVLGSGMARAEMESATPESQGVASQAIIDWIDACEKTFDGKAAGALHGFVIVRHGKVVAEGSWKPYDTLNEPHMLYSHSKSFTSTAVGLMADEGKFDIDERIVDIFSNEVPVKATENMRQMRVRDLLTMNDGMFPGDVCRQRPTENWVKTFLSDKVVNQPGCKFNYDSCATYMLSAIVKKCGGAGGLMEYLKPRLFDPLGMGKVWSTTCPDGIACGGWGMNMSTRDLAKFGQLYLQKGKWNGKQILSPDWVSLATTRQTWSGAIRAHNQTIGSDSDWAQGYGFQFWRCRHGAYRADGAFGQLTVVMPDVDAVVSVHAGLGDMQKEINLIWTHLLPAMGQGALPEDVGAQAKLKDRLDKLAIMPVEGTFEGCEKYCGIDYAVRQNARGIRGIGLRRYGKGWYLRLFVRHLPSTWEFPVGFGEWKKGIALIDHENYESPGMLIGQQPLMASGAVDTNGVLRIRARLTGTPGHIDFAFAESNGVKAVDGELWGMRGTKFRGEAVRKEPYDLPPLVKAGGWQKNRYQTERDFCAHEFGVRPVERPKDLAFRTVAEKPCLGGTAVHREVEISCKGPYAPFAFRAHAYLPKGADKVPTFVSISLKGRLAHEGFDPEKDDPSILSMPVKEAVARGFAVVTFTNEDVAKDEPKTCFTTGVFAAFGPQPRQIASWGALSAWAWGASRVLDWIETQPEFDAKRVAVIGHSRGGKAALWAGATDTRFALTCVNCSGMSGAKLNRLDLPWAESPEFIATVLPHWFSGLYGWWMRNGAPENYDQHHLLALVAPRKLAVGSGSEDQWAGPEGERLATEFAAQAWDEYGAGGLGANVFYHVRKGPHNLRLEDWEHYMKALETR